MQRAAQEHPDLGPEETKPETGEEDSPLEKEEHGEF